VNSILDPELKSRVENANDPATDFPSQWRMLLARRVRFNRLWRCNGYHKAMTDIHWHESFRFAN